MIIPNAMSLGIEPISSGSPSCGSINDRDRWLPQKREKDEEISSNLVGICPREGRIRVPGRFRICRVSGQAIALGRENTSNRLLELDVNSDENEQFHSESRKCT